MKQFLFLVFLPFLTISYAQKKDIKFGKIDKADFAWDKYPLDSNAHAVVLYDYGETELSYEVGLGAFVLRFHRHTRIKILDKAGASYADRSIRLRESGSAREKLTKFKAATYTFENGKINKTELGKKELLEEKVHDNLKAKKIAMPNIKDGCIIEIEYNISSPFYWNFRDWQFQYAIPVRYSQFKVAYPEWFQYNKQFKGYDLDYITVNEASKGNGNITFTSSRSSRPEILNYTEEKQNWVVENMPALEAEAYTSNINNYMVQVDFELASTNFPYAAPENFTNTWEEINTTLVESDAFGKQLEKSKTKFLKDKVEALTNSLTTDEEKVAAIYQHIKDKVIWNDRYNKYASQDLKETYNKGTGNVADINLLLVAMLRMAGISTDPIILSTKSNGILNPYFPSSRQFNYVIAQSKIGEKKTLLDATEKDLPMNLLPVRCYNDKGRLIKEHATKWVELTPTASYGSVLSLDLQLTESNQWTGTLKSRETGYAASKTRQKIKDEAEGKKVETTEDKFDFAQVEDVKVDDDKKALKRDASITLDNVMDGGDLLYFNPMAIGQIEKNPFKLKERKYPIDFNYKYKRIFSAKYHLPDGYTIDETPEDVVFSLPNKAGFFSYSIKMADNAINVIQQFKINKTLFAAEEYQALKQFYDLIVAKHAEQIVLRKKT